LFIAASFGLNGAADQRCMMCFLSARSQERDSAGKEASPEGGGIAERLAGRPLGSHLSFISLGDPRDRDQGLVVIGGDAEQQKDIVHGASPFSL
jgi:hypothetical protein